MSKHKIVLGLAFGDEGKGRIVDGLCAAEPIRAVVRFNGGAQAAHNVVQPDGRHHTFAQFGSGTFHHVPTHLSRFMLVNPLNLMVEQKALAKTLGWNPLDNLTIDEDALVTTPVHIRANRARAGSRGASCGQGIGETRSYAIRWPGDALYIRDLRDKLTTYAKLELMHVRLQEEIGEPLRSDDLKTVTGWYFGLAWNQLAGTFVAGDYLGHLLGGGPCVFEGAQGVLLDESYGFHPYTTWTDCTFENAETLLSEHGHRARRIGVVRPYMTRHGAGPLPTETDDATIIKMLHEPHNEAGEWQGPWRRGHLDLVLLRYARDVVGRLDEVAVTHVDELVSGGYDYLAVCEEYVNRGVSIDRIHVPAHDKCLHCQEAITDRLMDVTAVYDARGPETFLEPIQKALGAPITYEAWGPTHRDTPEQLLARAKAWMG